MNLLILLQQVATEIVSAEVQAAPEKMNLWTMTKYGGPIMIILGLMLGLAVYIFIERLVTVNKASKEDKSFMSRVKDYIHDGKIESAQKLCRDTNSPASRMIEKGISRLGRPLNEVLLAVENVGNMEVSSSKKFGNFGYNCRRRSYARFPWNCNRDGACVFNMTKTLPAWCS